MRVLRALLPVILLSTSHVATAETRQASNFWCDSGNTCFSAWAQTGAYPPGYEDGGGNDLTYGSASTNYSEDGWFLRAHASADLATGAIKAYASTNYAGGAYGALFEAFSFDLPEGVSRIEVPVTWTLEGTTAFTTGGPNGTWALFQITGWNPYSGGTTYDEEGNINYDDVSFDDFYFYDLDGTPNPNSIWENGSHNYTFSDTLIVDEKWIYHLNTFVGLGISGGGTLDYSNTSFFSIDLPAGVDLLSSSGVLLSSSLSGVVGAVPEPSTWLSMILGFGIAGSALRRSRRQPVGSFA